MKEKKAHSKQDKEVMEKLDQSLISLANKITSDAIINIHCIVCSPCFVKFGMDLQEMAEMEIGKSFEIEANQHNIKNNYYKIFKVTRLKNRRLREKSNK